MLMKKLLFILVIITIVSSCNSKDKDDKFTVTGKYTNAEHPVSMNHSGDTAAPAPVRKLYLYEIPFGTTNTPVILDSATLNGNQGTFELHGDGKDEGVYELVFDNGLIVLLSNDVNSIDVNVDLAKKDNYYTTKGSLASEEMKEFATQYNVHRLKVNNAFARMDSLKSLGGTDSSILASTMEKNKQIEELNNYIKNFISKTKHPAVALVVLGWASRSFTREEFEMNLNEIVKKFPDHSGVTSMKKDYDAKQIQMAEMQKRQQEYQSKQNIWTGKQAPELSLPDVNGNLVSISSFRGKYLLVDFWASWCRPCRIENPNLVKSFNQFKQKNFTILGVSIDSNKEDWIQAIAADQLNWTHISDLQYWDSKAVELFQFDGIPYNILIDPSGKVIAEGLRGEQLERKLSELLP